MDEEALNTSVRQISQGRLGVNRPNGRSKRLCANGADAKGKLKNGERLPAKARCHCGRHRPQI